MTVSPAIYGQTPGHAPVMLREVLDAASVQDGDLVVDATFGGGSYSRAFLDAAGCTVCAIDRDPDAMVRGQAMLTEYDGRLRLLEGPFADMADLLAAENITAANVIVFDLGMSSFQIDEPERGFAFSRDGRLDMRMSQSGQTAADLVNTASAEEIAHIIWSLGDERQSRRIARAIVEARADKAIETTTELAGVIEGAIGRRGGDKIHPATRTFQGLRLYLNDELGQLQKGLVAAERLLVPGGRLVVVSFHSLEDRIVKRFLRQRSGQAPRGSRHYPSSTAATSSAETPVTPSFTLIQRRALKPGDDETAVNPRARSARLRAAVRTDAPVWDLEATA